MLLATLLIITLVTITWALTRVSAWIVLHDPVWNRMDKEGANVEHLIAEAFMAARNMYLPAFTAAIGFIFLVLLWRKLSDQSKKN